MEVGVADYRICYIIKNGILRWRSGLNVRFAVGRPGAHSRCRVIPNDLKSIKGMLWRTSRQVCLLHPWVRRLTRRPYPYLKKDS